MWVGRGKVGQAGRGKEAFRARRFRATDSLVRLNFETKNVSCPFDSSFSSHVHRVAYLTLGLKQVELTAFKFFYFCNY